MNFGRDILIGLAVGDALGVPVEFKSRAYLQENPVFEMMGYGTHQQPKGTWSDDSSLAFCLADSLAENGYDLVDIARKTMEWFTKKLWTPHGRVFDIGNQTRSAIDELVAVFKRENFEALKNRTSTNEYSNGNGALMRILPLVLHTYGLKLEEKFHVIREVSSLTHGHIRSVLSCFIYLVFAEELMDGKSKKEAYLSMKSILENFFTRIEIPKEEQQKFYRILDMDISSFERDEIKSDGYVVHSLEASFWCLMRHDNYADTVLEAVNLGEDTDTTAAIAGGLAGLVYGVEKIPPNWKEQLVKINEIEVLADRLSERYEEKGD